MTGIQRLYKHKSVEYTSVPNWVVRDPSYSPNAFRLLAYLLSHAQGYELTYQQIERQTTLGRYAINEAAKFLEATGWLELRRDKGPDGRWLAKTWIIKDPEATVDDSTVDQSIVEPFHSGTTSGHIEKQLTKKNTNKRKTLSEGEQLFEEFWKEYPKKDDKRAALRAFNSALSRATFEELLAGAIRLANDPNLPDNKRFIKNAATWLNADAWLNGPLPDDPRKQRTNAKEEARKRLEKYLNEQD